MQNLKVSLIQANQVWEEKIANYANYERLLADVSADLILLPEMFNTGFSMNTSELGEEWGASASIEWLQKIATQKNAAIYTSLIIKEDAATYNRGVFVHPSGEVDFYDKRKTFGLAKEDQFFKSGEKETIVEYLGWKIQLQICYDLRFPEITRSRIEKTGDPAYDIILYVANWPDKRIAHWDALLKARAIENQSYVVACNRVGADSNNLIYSGHSQIIQPSGETIGNIIEVEASLNFEIEYTNLQDIRTKLPFLKDI